MAEEVLVSPATTTSAGIGRYIKQACPKGNVWSSPSTNCWFCASQVHTAAPAGRFGKRSESSCDEVRKGMETRLKPAWRGTKTVCEPVSVFRSTFGRGGLAGDSPCKAGLAGNLGLGGVLESGISRLI